MMLLPWFDLVLGIVPDYMHGVLVGGTKQLRNLWLSPSRYKKPCFIGNKVKAIDKRLKDMKPPDCIQRLPRELETSRAYFKASELQAWLLYYSVPCLIDILPQRYLEHFASLVEGVYILLGDSFSFAITGSLQKQPISFFVLRYRKMSLNLVLRVDFTSVTSFLCSFSKTVCI